VFLNSSFRRYRTRSGAKAFANVDFIVFRGFFMTEEARLSHLIIPGTMTYESEGSQYGAQRQVVWRAQAVQPPGRNPCRTGVSTWISEDGCAGRNIPLLRVPRTLRAHALDLPFLEGIESGEGEGQPFGRDLALS